MSLLTTTLTRTCQWRRRRREGGAAAASRKRVRTERRSPARRGGGEPAALCCGSFWLFHKAQKTLTAHVLLFRPAKGGDDSDDEEGASRPKKQRKPKERKKFEKVLWVFRSRVMIMFLESFLKIVFMPNFCQCVLIFRLSRSACHLLSKERSSLRPSSLLPTPLQMRMDWK